MDVREEDVKRIRLDQLADTEEGRPRVEHNADLRQHQARRMPRIARVISGGAQEMKLHFDDWKVWLFERAIGHECTTSKHLAATADSRRLWAAFAKSSPRTTEIT